LGVALVKLVDYLSSFIVFSRQTIPKTHDLRFLLERCAEVNPELMFLKEECKDLNSCGQDSRCPNDYFFVDKQGTEEAIKRAEKILGTIKKKFSDKLLVE